MHSVGIDVRLVPRADIRGPKQFGVGRTGKPDLVPFSGRFVLSGAG